jgi:hypothetical protein
MASPKRARDEGRSIVKSCQKGRASVSTRGGGIRETPERKTPRETQSHPAQNAGGGADLEGVQREKDRG